MSPLDLADWSIHEESCGSEVMLLVPCTIGASLGMLKGLCRKDFVEKKTSARCGQGSGLAQIALETSANTILAGCIVKYQIQFQIQTNPN